MDESPKSNFEAMLLKRKNDEGSNIPQWAVPTPPNTAARRFKWEVANYFDTGSSGQF